MTLTPNPYHSPRYPGRPDKRVFIWQLAACVIAWVLFLLIPAFSVTLVNYYPNILRLPLPNGDNILNRVSISIGVPMPIVLLTSLFGYLTTTFLAPMTLRWKIGIAVAWFPLIVVQVFAIVLCLVLLGNPL